MGSRMVRAGMRGGVIFVSTAGQRLRSWADGVIMTGQRGPHYPTAQHLSSYAQVAPFGGRAKPRATSWSNSSAATRPRPIALIERHTVAGAQDGCHHNGVCI